MDPNDAEIRMTPSAYFPPVHQTFLSDCKTLCPTFGLSFCVASLRYRNLCPVEIALENVRTSDVVLDILDNNVWANLVGL